MSAQSAAAMITLVLMDACTSLSPKADLQVPLPQRWSNATGLPAQPVTATTDGIAVAATRSWWRIFQDPALDQLLEAAMKSNLTVAAAQEQLRAAQTLVAVSDSAFRPNASAVTDSDTTADARRSYFQASLGALWELPILGRGRNQRRAAAARTLAATADLAAARASAAIEVARGYFSVQAANRSIELLHALEGLKAARLARLRTRTRIGLETFGEEQTVQAEALAVQLRVADLQMTRSKILQRIAAVLGEPAFDSTRIPARDTFPVQALRVDSTPADLLRSRPDVRRAQAEVIKAASDLGIARADIYPHLSIGGAITVAAPMSGAGGATNGVFSVGPVLEIPLFDWGARRAAADARAAELAAAVFSYRQTVFDAVAEVETALANLHHAAASVELQQRAVAVREELARRTNVSRRVGLDTDETNCSECAAIEAKLQLTNAQCAGAIAFVDLQEALGAPGLDSAVPTPDS